MKQPNLLFYCVKADQVENLKNLSLEYVSKVTSPSPTKKSRSPEKKLINVGSDSSLGWNGPGIEEPTSGFINFAKIFDKIEEKRRNT